MYGNRLGARETIRPCIQGKDAVCSRNPKRMRRNRHHSTVSESWYGNNRLFLWNDRPELWISHGVVCWKAQLLLIRRQTSRQFEGSADCPDSGRYFR